MLVNDILDMSKIEAGKVDLNPFAVTIDSFITELQDIVQPLVAARGNTIEFFRDPTTVTIYADRSRLRQVLLNLIGNAAKYFRARPDRRRVPRLQDRRSGWS